MIYRYFYDDQGNIESISYSKKPNMISPVGDNYVESSERVDPSKYCVDLSTLTLVERNQ